MLQLFPTCGPKILFWIHLAPLPHFGILQSKFQTSYGLSCKQFNTIRILFQKQSHNAIIVLETLTWIHCRFNIQIYQLFQEWLERTQISLCNVSLDYYSRAFSHSLHFFSVILTKYPDTHNLRVDKMSCGVWLQVMVHHIEEAEVAGSRNSVSHLVISTDSSRKRSDAQLALATLRFQDFLLGG